MTTRLVASCDDPQSPPAPSPIDSPEELIETLTRAYANRDPVLFASLLADDADHKAEYFFFLSAPMPNESGWNYAEESRIHRRMFDPAHPDPGGAPVYPDLWLQDLTITLTRVGEFVERHDLYVTAERGYLDPAKWRATKAEYRADVLFELAGETDYHVKGGAVFTVVEDLEKNIGEAGKFLLLSWLDLGWRPLPNLASGTTWADVKALYR